MRRLGIVVSLIALLGALLFVHPARALVIYTVNSTNDPGNGTCDAAECTLREAITAANVSAGEDRILFGFAGSGVHTITPSSVLPSIDDPVSIEGYTQPGSITNNQLSGSNAVPKIELNGHNAPFSTGLSFLDDSDGSNVSGLVFRDWGSNAIDVFGATGVDGIYIWGNFFGTHADGTAAAPNLRAIHAEGATALQFGGVSAQERNIVAASVTEGVDLASCTGCFVQGNLIGLAKDGVTPLGNGSAGVVLGGDDNIVGGLGNKANVIANNAKRSGAQFRAGVYVWNGDGNAIVGNSIYANRGRGIALGATRNANDAGDVDVGPNLEQNYPVVRSAINSAGKTRIRVRLKSTPSTTFGVQLFFNPSSQRDEGKTLITTVPGVSTDPQGVEDFFFEVAPKIPAGRYITATVTGPDGDTSEFSAPRLVTSS